MQSPETLRYLLLQVRTPSDPILVQEREAFAETLGVPQGAIFPWNVVARPPSPDLFDDIQVLLMGGSGRFSVYEEYPWMSALLDFIRSAVDRRFPMLASSFGFQALVQALGGQVVRDPAGGEVGTTLVYRTEASRSDPVLEALPPAFWAQSGHHDQVESLPSGLLHLARSEVCPFEAVRVEGAPIYGMQFHPELNVRRNLERFYRYIENYTPDGAEEVIDAVVASHRESPEANRIPRLFLERVVLGQD